MTRQELRAWIKAKFKAMGYQQHKSYLYKVFDDDYVVGFDLYPSSYCKAYSFECWIIYLPDEIKFPPNGKADLFWTFRFPADPSSVLELDNYQNDRNLNWLFEYEKYSIEQLEEWFEINYNFFMLPLMDKNYGLDIFRMHWRDHMIRFAPENVIKICDRAGLDKQEVAEYLDGCSNSIREYL